MTAGAVKLAHVWSSDMGIVLSLPQLRHFVARGWEVFAICPDGPRLDEVRRAGVTWLPIPLSRRLVDPAGDLRSAARIATYCRRHRFDLVHTHNVKTGFIGRLFARAGGAPRVLHTMHGMPFGAETPAMRRLGHAGLEWLACRFVDRVLVQSEEDLRTMQAHRLLPAGRLTRIGNGVPLDRFDPARADGAAVRAELGIAPHELLVVSAGRLVRSKGFVELAEATRLARIEEPRLRVAIVGPRDLDKADALTDRELDAVRAAGVLLPGERADMPDVFAAADIVTLPSWHEGMPRVLIEGAALGKPLVATNVRGCREVVVDPDGGALTPVRDAHALAHALVALARDPARRKAAGAFNRARALAEYDVSAVIRRVETVYEELLGA